MAIISTKYNRYYYYKKVVRQAVQLSYVYYTTSKALLTLRSLLDIFPHVPTSVRAGVTGVGGRVDSGLGPGDVPNLGSSTASSWIS